MHQLQQAWTISSSENFQLYGIWATFSLDSPPSFCLIIVYTRFIYAKLLFVLGGRGIVWVVLIMCRHWWCVQRSQCQYVMHCMRVYIKVRERRSDKCSLRHFVVLYRQLDWWIRLQANISSCSECTKHRKPARAERGVVMNLSLATGSQHHRSTTITH